MPMDSTMTEFQVRASIVGDLVRAIAQGPDTNASLIPKSALTMLAHTPTDAWVSGALLLELYERVIAGAGEEALVEAGRRTAYLTHAGPFLRKFREHALRFASLTPSLIFRWIPGARAMTVRGCGEATYAPMERGCRIVVHGAPAYVVAHRPFLLASRGSFQSVLDMTGLSGTVTLIGEGTTLTYELRWWKRRVVDVDRGRDTPAGSANESANG
jgi:hypothetical protein